MSIDPRYLCAKCGHRRRCHGTGGRVRVPGSRTAAEWERGYAATWRRCCSVAGRPCASFVEHTGYGSPVAMRDIEAAADDMRRAVNDE